MLGLQQIKNKSALTIEQIVEFAKLSSLVTGDMHQALTEGLHAYESGQYSMAIPVLIPKVEAMLRELLKLIGISTRKPIRNAKGATDLKTIHEVLRDERVIDTLEEDLAFFLRAVYMDK